MAGYDGKVRLIAREGRGTDSNYTDAFYDELEKAIKGDPSRADAYRKSVGESLANGKGRKDYEVVFEATPEITESGSVNYYEESGIRAPGSVVVYMGSPARNFSISAKFISRTPQEAKLTDTYIHRLKSWRQPESFSGGINAGVPTILYLQGYGKMFKDIPVVMTDLSIDFSSEHDYIRTSGGRGDSQTFSRSTSVQVLDDDTLENKRDSNGRLVKQAGLPIQNDVSLNTQVPIITTVNISLKETRSTEGSYTNGFKSFDIFKFRMGRLPEW